MKICENQAMNYKSINVSNTDPSWDINSIFNYADEIRDGNYIYKYAGEDNTNTELSPSVIWERDKEIFPVWVRVRPTNYYAAIDGATGTQTTLNGNMVIKFDVSNFDTLALLNLEVEDVLIELKDLDTNTIVYSNDVDMQDESNVVDFYSYCFNPFAYKPSLYIDSLPLFSNAEITITLFGSTTKVGRIVLGRSFFVGDTEYGASLDIESYSLRDVDVFGNVTLKQRGSVNIDNVPVRFATSKAPELREKFKELDAKAILFIGDESEDTIVDNLLNFGYWTSFSTMLQNPVSTTSNVGIKGIL